MGLPGMPDDISCTRKLPPEPYVAPPAAYEHCQLARASEQLPAGILVSSTSAHGLANAAKYRPPFWRTPLLPYGRAAASAPPLPLWLYTESSLKRRNGDTAAADAEDEIAGQVRNLTTACTVDLFDALPGLYEMLTSPTSCIDSFYRLAGPVEPYTQGPMHLYSGKILVRKVASLWHAALANPAGSVVLWLDMDVEVMGELYAPVFWHWMAEYDVVYLPFRMPAHLFNPKTEAREAHKKPIQRIDDFTWNTDTGAHAVRAAPKALALLREVMDHYDGGAVRMAKHCLCAPDSNFSYNQWVAPHAGGRHHEQGDGSHAHQGEGSHAHAPLERRAAHAVLPCNQSWFNFNLYLDDLFAWTLFVQAAGRASSRPVPGIDTKVVWDPVPGVTQGWFASGNRSKARPGSPDVCPSPWKHIPIQGFACPGVTPFASPFDCVRMFLHHLGSYGAYNRAYKANVSHHPTYMQMPNALLEKQKNTTQLTEILFHMRLYSKVHDSYFYDGACEMDSLQA